MTMVPDELLVHDRVHRPGAQRGWRESYYFSFFDPAHRIGGFTSIGKRAASGHTGSINVIWGPELPTLVASELDTFSTFDDQHDVLGLSYRGQEPFGDWRISFTGRLNDGGAGVECREDAIGSAVDAAATVPVSYDLTFSPTHPPYRYREREEWSELFTGHIDEAGTVRGTLEIGGRRYDISGHGGKDHSWGVRNWFAPKEWRWVDLVSAGGPHLTLWRASFQPGDWLGDGAVYADGGVTPLTGYTEKVSTSDGARIKPLPETLRADLAVADRPFGLTGRVHRVLPVRFTRDTDQGRLISWNDRALVECALDDGATAWANVEFAELVRDGAP